MPDSLKPSRRPWWAAPLIGGIGIGIGLFARQFVATEARAETPRITTAGLTPEALVERQKQTDNWRDKIELKLDEILKEASETRERLARIEGRLDRK